MATMLDEQIQTILNQSQAHGWVLEHHAKQILAGANIAVPEFHLAASASEATDIAKKIGYPVVAKIVSPAVVHKSDVDGVALDIRTDEQLDAVFQRYARHQAFLGMLIEPMISGIELIVGGKVDTQFGPVVLLGIGGTGVEIYRDTALRMAPIQKKDVASMVDSLTGNAILKGFRGTLAVDMQMLTRLVLSFSKFFVKWAHQIASIDLNPVICSAEGCTVADARMMLMSKNNMKSNIYNP
jgi:succinyl-CoA synthetase beta subunit